MRGAVCDRHKGHTGHSPTQNTVASGALNEVLGSITAQVTLYFAKFVYDSTPNLFSFSLASGNTAHIRRVNSQLVSQTAINPRVKPVRLQECLVMFRVRRHAGSLLSRSLAVTDNDTGSLQTGFGRRDSRHLEQRHS